MCPCQPDVFHERCTGEKTARRRVAPARGARALCDVIVNARIICEAARGHHIFRGFCRKRRRFREPVRRKRPSWGFKDQHVRNWCKPQENARLEEERQLQEVPCKTAVSTLVASRVGTHLPSHNHVCHCTKMLAAAETHRQEEHRKVRKSNSTLQSTRSLSVRHVRRVLGSVLMLIAYSIYVAGASQGRGGGVLLQAK